MVTTTCFLFLCKDSYHVCFNIIVAMIEADALLWQLSFGNVH